MYKKKTRILSVICIILTFVTFIASCYVSPMKVYADSNDNRALDLAIAEGKTRTEISQIATQNNGGQIDVNSMRTIALYLSNFYQPFVTSITDGSDIGVSNKTEDDKEAEKTNETTGQFATDSINALTKYCGVDEEVAKILVKNTLKQTVDTCHRVYVDKKYVEKLFNAGGKTKAVSMKGSGDSVYTAGFRGFSRTLHRYKNNWSSNSNGSYNFYTNYDTSIFWRLSKTVDGTENGEKSIADNSEGPSGRDGDDTVNTTVQDFIDKLFTDGGSVTVDSKEYIQLSYFVYLAIIQYAQNKAAPENTGETESKAVVNFYWYDKDTNSMIKCFDSAGTCTQAFLWSTNELDTKYGVGTSLSSLDVENYDSIYSDDDNSMDNAQVEKLRKALIFFNPICVDWVGNLIINDGVNSFVMVPACLNPYSLVTISDEKTDYLNGVSVKALTYKANNLIESAKGKTVYGLQADTYSSTSSSAANSKTSSAQKLCTQLYLYSHLQASDRNLSYEADTYLGSEMDDANTNSYLGEGLFKLFYNREYNNQEVSKDDKEGFVWCNPILFDATANNLFACVNLLTGEYDGGEVSNTDFDAGTIGFSIAKKPKGADAKIVTKITAAKKAKSYTIFRHKVDYDDGNEHTFLVFFDIAGLHQYLKAAQLKCADNEAFGAFQTHFENALDFNEGAHKEDTDDKKKRKVGKTTYDYSFLDFPRDSYTGHSGYSAMAEQGGYIIKSVIKDSTAKVNTTITFNEQDFPGEDGRYDVATKSAMPTTGKEHFFRLSDLGITSGSKSDRKKHVKNGNNAMFTFNRYILVYGDTDTKNYNNSNLDGQLSGQRAKPFYDIMSNYGLYHSTNNFSHNYVTFPSLIWSTFACADEPVGEDDGQEYANAIKQWGARVVAGWRTLDSNTTYQSSYAYIRLSGTRNDAGQNMGGYKMHDQVIYFPDYSVDISDLSSAVKTANIFETQENLDMTSSLSDLSPYTATANGYGHTLPLPDASKELYRNIFMTYAFAEANYEADPMEFDEDVNVIDLKCNFDAFPEGSDTIDFTYIEDTTGKEIESFVYYLLHPTKGIAYIATWFKNKMAGILLYLHESIVGSSDSNYTTGMTRFLGSSSYTTMPKLTDIKLLNNILSVYNNLLIYMIMLLAMILLCFIVVGEITIQRALAGLLCFSFLAFLPPYLLNSSANISNLASDQIFSNKFEYWAISQMETYMDIINTSEGPEVLTDNSLELATQVSLASASTSVGGESKTGYSGTMIKWMSPKKFASSLVAEALQQTAVENSTAVLVKSMLQTTAQTAGSGQEFVHNVDNALYLYRDYVDIYRYSSNSYNIDTYCNGFLTQDINKLVQAYTQNNSTQSTKEHGVYNVWHAKKNKGDSTDIKFSKLGEVHYSSGLAVSDLITTNYMFGLDNNGTSIYSQPVTTSYTNNVDKISDNYEKTLKEQSSIFSMQHGFLYNTFGDTLLSDNGINYFSYNNTRASTLLLTYAGTVAQTQEALDKLNNDIKSGKIDITYKNFVQNESICYGIPHNSFDVDIKIYNNLEDDYTNPSSDKVEHDYKRLSDFYYDLYSESPYFFFNYNIRDQLINTKDAGYQFSKADRTSSKNNLTSMWLVNDQDYFYNHSAYAGNGAGELRDFMNFHDFFYYIVPQFQPGLDLLYTWDTNFGYNLHDDCSLKFTNAGTISYNAQETSASQDAGENKLSSILSNDDWNKLTTEEQTELWHDYNVNLINLSYCSWLDTMEDCDYAKPETIHVLGQKYTVQNPLDPTSYYSIALDDTKIGDKSYKKGDIIAGRYMIFSRSEMKYYGLEESDLTQVEKKILKVQDEVYKETLKLMNYKVVSDENLIHAFAMLETFVFNREFSQKNLATGGGYILYPQGYELKAFTYDAYLRLVLAESSSNIELEDEGTTDEKTGNQEVTSIYKRIMDDTSIFFGVLLIFNDLLAVYLIPALKVLILVVLFFLSIFLLISSILKLDFNIVNNFVRSLLAPLCVFTLSCIGLSFLTSLFMSNGADYITEGSTTLSLGDPTMTIIIMIIMNGMYVYMNVKLLIKCFRAMVDYMKAVGFATLGAVTGAARAIGNGLLGNNGRFGRRGRVLRGRNGYYDDMSDGGGARSRGALNGAKALAGGAIAGAATSAALAHANSQNSEQDDKKKLDYYNGLAGQDALQGSKDAKADSERLSKHAEDTLKANRKRHRSEINADKSKAAYEKATNAKDAMHDKDLSVFSRAKAFGSYAKNSISGGYSASKSRLQGMIEHNKAYRAVDHAINGSDEFRGVNAATVRQIKSERSASKRFAGVSQQLEARHNSWSVKQEAEQARLANERRAAQNKRMQDYGRAFGEGFYSQRPKELHGKAKRIQAREDERNTRRNIKNNR